MVDHFTQADEEYSRLVKEGIEKIMKETIETEKEQAVPGRESGKTKFGQGTLKAKEAAEDAVDQGHEADPY
ncbi:hypothetical protein NCCP2331_36130 [Sporosarcina sp. NCCP-2331]|nr:hypothetical protein NCCP2331_36130 [Sporosarcina sp. NCCP-2331]GLB57817.1 hypothetical protein NCCP2378_36100 [Sporosarcina sp. NCCP-2378]